MIKIAIDGPSGSGKSTLARSLAKLYGYVYVDTGALYRTIGLYMLKNVIDTKDSAAVAKNLENISLELKYDASGTQHVWLNGEDVGDSIRTSEVSAAASAVSAVPAVRAFLLDTQREMAESSNVVMDGRDIGTVIFPDAQVKIFLTAGNLARAERRYKELLDKGENITLEKVLSDMEARDTNDRSRKEAPATPAEDAVLLDNSGFAPEDTLRAACEIIDGKLGKNLN